MPQREHSVAHRYFSDPMLAVLLDPAGWRLVSSLCPPDLQPLNQSHLRDWAQTVVERHAHQEVVLALNGEAFFGFRREAYPCRPGDVFFIDALDEHSYPYPTFYPDVDHLLIQLTRKAVCFRTYCVRDGREPPQRVPNRLLTGSVSVSLFEESFSRLRRNPQLPAPLLRQQLLNLIRFLAGEIVTEGFLPESEAGLSRRACHERMIRVVREHIEDTAGRGVSLHSLALLTGYSQSHLRSLFKSLTGQTIHQYLDAVRVLRVRDLLEQGSSKKEIGTALGFSCTAAFSHWLRTRCPALVHVKARE